MKNFEFAGRAPLAVGSLAGGGALVNAANSQEEWQFWFNLVIAVLSLVGSAISQKK